MHIFLDAGMGNVLAFFELPNSPKMGVDPNTPEWVQHIAFEVETRKAPRHAAWLHEKEFNPEGGDN